MKINELTQGMAEELVTNLPDGELPIVKWQRAYVEAAIKVGWVTLEIAPTQMLRKEIFSIYTQLGVIWKDANTLPNG